MGRKAKFSSVTKIEVVLRCLSGKTSAYHEAKLLGINRYRVLEWISLYQSLGATGLNTTSKNTAYSVDAKRNAVLDYLNGEGSYLHICKKYGIRSTRQLRNWILKYNGHMELKASGTGGKPIMTKGRKTTFDERVEIVQYCIAHEHNYAETADKYQVSYQQARNYTIKYEDVGVNGLLDRRGKRKTEAEMSELEKLRAENKILRAEKERAEMEVSFLKKLEEIEGRRS
ncbi:MAG: helix-turn-helix domain-containing protein [Hungatella sp.]|jgi:transposase-like protein|nr:helix-turn-helix domain-containing protein [Hungatella sp.]